MRCAYISSPQLILVEFFLDLAQRNLILEFARRVLDCSDELFKGEVTLGMSFGDENSHLGDGIVR